MNRLDTAEAYDGSSESSGSFVKVLVMLYTLFLFVSSDIFNKYILETINGATSGRTATTFGTLVSGIILVLLFAASKYAIEHDLI
jgi:ATP/ADP translocase